MAQPAAASSSSTSSSATSSTEDLPLRHPVPEPCSPPILRNPLYAQPAAAAAAASSPPKSKAAQLANTIQNAVVAGPSSLLSSSPPAPAINGRTNSGIRAKVMSISSPPPPSDHPLHPDNSSSASSSSSSPPPRGRWSRSNSYSEGPAPSHERQPRTDSGGRSLSRGTSEGGDSNSSTSGQSLKFAPLPPGRRQYRSNSLTLGVAARAKMIQQQGGSGGNGSDYSSSPRYGGPQLWYQPGAPLPDQVYTYKDVQRGLGKIWRKVARKDGSPSGSSGRRNSASSTGSTSSTSTAGTETSTNERHAREMEERAKIKGKTKEIEHIEEVDEGEEEEEVQVGHEDGTLENALEENDYDDDDDDDDDEASRGLRERLSTLGLGLDIGKIREPSPPPSVSASANGGAEGSVSSSSTTTNSNAPLTPEQEEAAEHVALGDELVPPTRLDKGKGKEVERRHETAVQ